jgi:hypothetical protein
MRGINERDEGRERESELVAEGERDEWTEGGARGGVGDGGDKHL